MNLKEFVRILEIHFGDRISLAKEWHKNEIMRQFQHALNDTTIDCLEQVPENND